MYFPLRAWKEVLESLNLSKKSRRASKAGYRPTLETLEARQMMTGTPPTIESLLITPSPVTQGVTITLTAQLVGDSDGTVESVAFYGDSNNNQVLDLGVDQLLTEVTTGGVDWSTTLSSSVLTLGTNTVFAVAIDDEELQSLPVSAEVEVGSSLVDNGDAAYSESSAGWGTAIGLGGYGDDYRYHASGTGGIAATWSFSGLDPTKRYEIFATWNDYDTHAGNAPFTIVDGSTNLATVRVNQRVLPTQSNFENIPWDSLGVYSIQSGELLVRLSDDANGYVSADAVRIVETEAPLSIPDGALPVTLVDDLDASYSEADGGWTTAAGYGGYENSYRYHSAGSGQATATWTFTDLDPTKHYEVFATWRDYATHARNAPITMLDGTSLLATVRVNQRVAPNQVSFESTMWNTLGVYSIENGTLTIRLSNAADGYVTADAIRIVETTADLSVPEDDSFPLMINEQETGYAESGSGWTLATGYGGYGDSYRYHAAGTGTNAATWTFNDLDPTKHYEVFATWKNYDTHAHDAPFTILDGTTSLATVRVNQRVAPNQSTFENNPWNSLGIYSIENGTLVVRLTDAADGYVVADAIRLVETESPLHVPDDDSFLRLINELETGYAESGGDWSLATGYGGYGNSYRYHAAGTGTNAATWTFANLDPTKHYEVLATWKNYDTHARNAPFTMLDGASSLATVRVNQRIAPNQSTFGDNPWNSLGVYSIENGTLAVRLTDSADGYVVADAIRLVETQAPLTVPDDDPILVNDLETGYAETGSGWTLAAGYGGYQNEYRYHVPGVGENSATWTFANLDPSKHYQVFATWKNFDSHASSAPFTVLDGLNALATVRVDQRQLPTQVTFENTPWNNLGVYQIASGSLTLRLSDDSTGEVIADAVRIVETDAPLSVPANDATALLIDDQETAYAESGTGWDLAAGYGGYGNSYRYAAAGTGANVATWTFTNLDPTKRYEVFGTWKDFSSHASNAPFTFLDGTTPLATVRVNQTAAPNQATFNNLTWNSLGSYEVQGGTLTIQLSDDANGYVLADAIRLVEMDAATGETPHAPVLDLLEEYVAYRGHLFQLTVNASDDDLPNDELHYSLGVGRPMGSSIGALSGILYWAMPANASLGDYAFEIRVSDDTAPPLTDSAEVNINLREAPVVTAVGESSTLEGATYTLSLSAGSFLNPMWEIDWGDGSAIETVSGAEIEPTHVFPDGTARHRISARLTDGYTTITTTPIDVLVQDVAPTLQVSGASSVNEGNEYILSLSSTDPGDDLILRWIVNWGDGAIEEIEGNVSSATHIYADGTVSVPIQVSAIDEDGEYRVIAPLVTSFDDLSFSQDGRQITSVTSTNDWVLSSVLQSDGKTLLLTTNSSGWLTLSRLTENGDLDSDFGDEGRIQTAIRSDVVLGANLPAAVRILANGQIAVVGTHIDASLGTQRPVIQMLSIIGDTLSSYGTGGISSIDAFGDASVEDVQVQSNLLVLLVRTGTVLKALRVTSTGAIATGFNATDVFDGLGTRQSGESSVLAVQSDGKLLVNRFAPPTNSASNHLARLNSTGSLDSSFGVNGRVEIQDSWEVTIVRSILVDNIGRIRLVKQATWEQQILGLRPNGSVDRAFGNDGTLLLTNGGLNGSLLGYLDNQSRIVTVRTATSLGFPPGSSQTASFTAERFSFEGERDLSFGAAGYLSRQLPSPHLAAVVEDGLGRLSIVGSDAAAAEAASGDVFVVRSLLERPNLWVTVHDVDPEVTLNGASTVLAQHTYTIDMAATDVGADRILKWQVNWGDGSTVQEISGNLSTASHVYNSPGNYSIQVSALDDDGLGQASLNVVALAALAPDLEPIVPGTATVTQGEIFAVRARGSNPNTPALPLVYSLTAGAPAGAHIDATTGVVSWPVALTQTIGTYPITVRAAIEGAPTLFDEQTLSVEVAARTPVARGNDVIQIAVGDAYPILDLFGAFEDRLDADSALQFEVTGISNPTILENRTPSQLTAAINTATGQLALPVWSYQLGTSTITIKATNSSGGVAYRTTTLTIGRIDNTADALHVEELALAVDSGISLVDKITGDPTVIGKVAGAAGGGLRIVEFDHNYDGRVDGSVVTSEDGTFVYTPTGLPSGGVNLRARVKTWDATGALTYSTWPQPFYYQFSPESAPVTPAITSIRLYNDTGASWTDRATSSADVALTIHNPSNLTNFTVELDFNNDGTPDSTQTTSSSFPSFSAPSGTISYGMATVGARIIATDGSPGAWSTVAFVYAQNPDGPAAQAQAASLARQDSFVGKISAIGDMLIAQVERDALTRRDESIREYQQGVAGAQVTRDAAFATADAAFAAAQSSAAGVYSAAQSTAHGTFVTAATTQGLPTHEYPIEGFSWGNAPVFVGGPGRPLPGSVGPANLEPPSFSGVSFSPATVSGYNTAVSNAEILRNTQMTAAQNTYNNSVSGAGATYTSAVNAAEQVKQSSLATAKTAKDLAMQTIDQDNPVKTDKVLWNGSLVTWDDAYTQVTNELSAATAAVTARQTAARNAAAAKRDQQLEGVGYHTAAEANILFNYAKELALIEEWTSNGKNDNLGVHQDGVWDVEYKASERRRELTTRMTELTAERNAWRDTRSAELLSAEEVSKAAAEEVYNKAVAAAVKVKQDAIATAARTKSYSEAQAKRDYDVAVAEARETAVSTWAGQQNTAWADYQKDLIESESDRVVKVADASLEFAQKSADALQAQTLALNAQQKVIDESLATATKTRRTAQLDAALDKLSSQIANKLQFELTAARAMKTQADLMNYRGFNSNGGEFQIPMTGIGTATVALNKAVAKAQRERGVADRDAERQYAIEMDFYFPTNITRAIPAYDKFVVALAANRLKYENAVQTAHAVYDLAANDAKRVYEVQVHVAQKLREDLDNTEVHFAEVLQGTAEATFTESSQKADIDLQDTRRLEATKRVKAEAAAQQVLSDKIAEAESGNAKAVAGASRDFEAAVAQAYYSTIVSWSNSQGTAWATLVAAVVEAQKDLLISTADEGEEITEAMADASLQNAKDASAAQKAFVDSVADKASQRKGTLVEPQRTLAGQIKDASVILVTAKADSAFGFNATVFAEQLTLDNSVSTLDAARQNAVDVGEIKHLMEDAFARFGDEVDLPNFSHEHYISDANRVDSRVEANAVAKRAKGAAAARLLWTTHVEEAKVKRAGDDGAAQKTFVESSRGAAAEYGSQEALQNKILDQEIADATHTRDRALADAQKDFEYSGADAGKEYGYGVADAVATYEIGVASALSTYALSSALAYRDAVQVWAAAEHLATNPTVDPDLADFLAGVAQADLEWQTTVGPAWMTWASDTADANKELSKAQADSDHQLAYDQADAQREYLDQVFDGQKTQSYSLASATYLSTVGLTFADKTRAISDAELQKKYAEDVAKAEQTYALTMTTADEQRVKTVLDARLKDTLVEIDAIPFPFPAGGGLSEQLDPVDEAAADHARMAQLNAAKAKRVEDLAKAEQTKATSATAADKVLLTARETWNNSLADGANNAQTALTTSTGEALATLAQDSAAAEDISARAWALAAKQRGYDVAAADKQFALVTSVSDAGWVVDVAGSELLYQQVQSLQFAAEKAAIAAEPNATPQEIFDAGYAAVYADWVLTVSPAYTAYWQTRAIANQTADAALATSEEEYAQAAADSLIPLTADVATAEAARRAEAGTAEQEYMVALAQDAGAVEVANAGDVKTYVLAKADAVAKFLKESLKADGDYEVAVSKAHGSWENARTAAALQYQQDVAAAPEYNPEYPEERQNALNDAQAKRSVAEAAAGQKQNSDLALAASVRTKAKQDANVVLVEDQQKAADKYAEELAKTDEESAKATADTAKAYAVALAQSERTAARDSATALHAADTTLAAASHTAALAAVAAYSPWANSVATAASAFWTSQRSAEETLLADEAAVRNEPLWDFLAERSAMFADWSATQAPAFVSLVGDLADQNLVYATATIDAANTFDLTVAEEDRDLAYTEADENRDRQLTVADAQHDYTHAISSPAKTYQVQVAKAETAYRVAVAKAERDKAAGGSQTQYDADMAAARATQDGARQSALSSFANSEAATALDTGTDSVHADHDLIVALIQARRDREAEVSEASETASTTAITAFHTLESSAALATKSYDIVRANSLAAAFADWADSTDNAWVEEQAAEYAARAVQTQSLATADYDRAVAKADADQAHRLSVLSASLAIQAENLDASADIDETRADEGEQKTLADLKARAAGAGTSSYSPPNPGAITLPTFHTITTMALPVWSASAAPNHDPSQFFAGVYPTYMWWQASYATPRTGYELYSPSEMAELIHQEQVAATRGVLQYTAEAASSAFETAQWLTKSETWYGRPGHEEDGILTTAMRSTIGDERLVNMSDGQVVGAAFVLSSSIVVGFYVAPAGIVGSLAAGAAIGAGTELGLQIVTGESDIDRLVSSTLDGVKGGAVGWGIGKVVSLGGRGASAFLGKMWGGASRTARAGLGDVGETASRIANRMSHADEAATNISKVASQWTSRTPGIQVRQIGNYWVKRVDPNAPAWLQRWGKATIDAQEKALKKLLDAGSPAAKFRRLKNGALATENVGPTMSWKALADREYWKSVWRDMRALKQIPDLKPQNYGAGYRPFDPVVDPITVTIATVGGLTAAGTSLYFFDRFGFVDLNPWE